MPRAVTALRLAQLLCPPRIMSSVTSAKLGSIIVPHHGQACIGEQAARARLSSS